MDKVEYVYGYEQRNKQKVPVYTVAIVHEEYDGDIYFGIGLSICSDNDQPIKTEGRKIALARARGAIARQGDIESKPRNQSDPTDCILLGMRTPWEDAHASILDFELPLALTSRVYAAIRFMESRFSVA
jgi:hypothetical protein